AEGREALQRALAHSRCWLGGQDGLSAREARLRAGAGRTLGSSGSPTAAEGALRVQDTA
ncbi:unnamed protein product, partial [Symbiodinium sp. CCMP2456]